MLCQSIGRRMTFDAFRASIGARLGNVLINVLIARQNDEAYWVVKALRAPNQTTADQTLGLGAAMLPKSTWVVEVQWYEHDVEESTDDRHVYRRSHVNQFPLTARSLIAVSHANNVQFE